MDGHRLDQRSAGMQGLCEPCINRVHRRDLGGPMSARISSSASARRISSRRIDLSAGNLAASCSSTRFTSWACCGRKRAPFEAAKLGVGCERFILSSRFRWLACSFPRPAGSAVSGVFWLRCRTARCDWKVLIAPVFASALSDTQARPMPTCFSTRPGHASYIAARCSNFSRGPASWSSSPLPFQSLSDCSAC